MGKQAMGVIVGSNRRDSINRRLALALAALLADRYDIRFIAGAAAVLFVTPEHNRSIPAVLKNAIDWGSKPTDQNVWRGKPAAITGTSMGAIGTAVGQQHLRQILGILGMTVMGGEAYITFKPEPVDHDGHFIDEAKRAFCSAYMNQFATLVRQLVPPTTSG